MVRAPWGSDRIIDSGISAERFWESRPERVNGSSLHSEDWTAAVLHELVDDGLGIIVVIQSASTRDGSFIVVM